jgi:hypothetical protein
MVAWVAATSKCTEKTKEPILAKGTLVPLFPPLPPAPSSTSSLAALDGKLEGQSHL